MNEDKLSHLLRTIPGAKRAAQGLIVPGDNGALFHIRSVHDKKELEGLTPEETLYFEFCSKNEILRLRELRNSHDYLLRIRANSIVDSPRAVRVMASRRHQFEQNGRPWSLSHYYHSKDHYQKGYIKHLARANSKVAKLAPAGFAPINEANALCIRSLVGDVIVASENLERFYYFMSIAFYGNQLGIQDIDRADALIIALRIMKGVEAQDFDLDPRGELPIEVERELNLLVTHQLQFTFGHEYAHLLRGHLSEAENVFSQKTSKEDYLRDLRVYSHKLEYEADQFALTHIQHNPKTFLKVAQGAFSVLIFLHYLGEVYGTVFRTTDFSVSDTHPSPLDRIYQLHTGLGKNSPIAEREINGMLSMCAELEHFLKMRAEGQREDLFTLYGSVYLSSYVTKPKRDRYDY